MRNKCAPKRGGNCTGRGSTRSSNSNAPKKDSKTDKSKGLENCIFTCGRSEDCRKTHECPMSHTRQNCDNGHDIASSIEKGAAFDFTAVRPMMTTPREPTEEELTKHLARAQKHNDEVKSLEMIHKV